MEQRNCGRKMRSYASAVILNLERNCYRRSVVCRGGEPRLAFWVPADLACRVPGAQRSLPEARSHEAPVEEHSRRRSHLKSKRNVRKFESPEKSVTLRNRGEDNDGGVEEGRDYREETESQKRRRK